MSAEDDTISMVKLHNHNHGDGDENDEHDGNYDADSSGLSKCLQILAMTTPKPRF